MEMKFLQGLYKLERLDKNNKFFSLYKKNFYAIKLAKFKPPMVSLVRTKIAQFEYGERGEAVIVTFPVCCTCPLWFSTLNALCLCWLMLGRSSHFHLQARI